MMMQRGLFVMHCFVDFILALQKEQKIEKMKERGIGKNKRTIVKHPDKIASSVEL